MCVLFKNNLLTMFFLFFSFQSDSQMIIDAAITVSYRAANAADEVVATREALYPARHRMTLPLNGINNIFQNCEVAFNFHTKLDCDR
jgi:hypothetical protein